MTLKHLLTVMVLTAVPFVSGMDAMADTYKCNETPKYTVERTEGPIKLRGYAPRIMAEVADGGSQSQAVTTGFRVFAGYIFGPTIVGPRWR